jgi:hypothetical protein
MAPIARIKAGINMVWPMPRHGARQAGRREEDGDSINYESSVPDDTGECKNGRPECMVRAKRCVNRQPNGLFGASEQPAVQISVQ